jgi:hypothetical protein
MKLGVEFSTCGVILALKVFQVWIFGLRRLNLTHQATDVFQGAQTTEYPAQLYLLPSDAVGIPFLLL